LTSVAAHAQSRKPAVRRRGRHKAPSQTEKVARLATRAAPVIAVAGALAAFPQVRSLASTAYPAAAARPAAADAITATAAQRALSIDATAARNETTWGQEAKTADARSAAVAAAHRAARALRRAEALRRQDAPPAAAAPVAAPPPAPPAPPAVGRHRAPVCAATGGMLPENVGAIVDFLVSHGYTDNAAAGIAGNIYQESGGNPESGGSGAGGLIGWTPLPAGYITGNSSADLQTQLAGILTFNAALSAGLPALNAAATPAAAADIYVTDFEHASLPAAGTREASANAVAAACGI
jgi:Phage tail lysozyme